MPNDTAHIEQAQKNLIFLESFFEKYEFNDWAITVAFYMCVHIVEAAIFMKKDLTYQGVNIHLENSDNLPIAASRANLPPPTNLSWTAKLNHAFRNIIIAENFSEIWEPYDFLYKKSRAARYYCYKWSDKDINFIIKYAPTYIVNWIKQKFVVNLKMTTKILKS